VTLNGSGSTTSTPPPGTQDDLSSLEWFEGFGTPSETWLGSGSSLETILPLGSHAITLRVTDSAGEIDRTEAFVTVRDTTPPIPRRCRAARRSLARRPQNGADRDDLGGRGPVRSLGHDQPRVGRPAASRTTRSGRETAPTRGDIQGADLGTPDTRVLLRAERAGGGTGRTYELRYQAVDRSGNASSAVAFVTVPNR
jgi:hypothetical protein